MMTSSSFVRCSQHLYVQILLLDWIGCLIEKTTTVCVINLWFNWFRWNFFYFPWLVELMSFDLMWSWQIIFVATSCIWIWSDKLFSTHICNNESYFSYSYSFILFSFLWNNEMFFKWSICSSFKIGFIEKRSLPKKDQTFPRFLKRAQEKKNRFEQQQKEKHHNIT